MPVSMRMREAAAARRSALEAKGSAPTRSSVVVPPAGVARSLPFAAEMRTATVTKDGRDFVKVTGTASVYERGYDMWDTFGPYREVVSVGAGAQSLADSPDVVFLVNHKGLAMARTTNGSLTLREDADGLHSEALLNPSRSDVADLVAGINDGVITEMSFAFEILSGEWSPDFTEYRITRYDINRGDVSAVNYGANPFTSISARSAEFMRMLEEVDGTALRAAYERLNERMRADESKYKRAKFDLLGLRDRLAQRALTPADTSTLTALLTQLAAADAAFDPFVDAVCSVDEGLDLAQAALSDLLGVADPDESEEMPAPAAQQQNAGPSLSYLRAQMELGRI